MSRTWIVGGLVAAVAGFAGAYAIGSAGGEDSSSSAGGSVETITRSLDAPTAANLEAAPALPSLRRSARTTTKQTAKSRQATTTQQATTTPQQTATQPRTTTQQTTTQPSTTVEE